MVVTDFYILKDQFVEKKRFKTKEEFTQFLEPYKLNKLFLFEVRR